MGYKQMNLLTKTICSTSPEDQDKAVEDFQKKHTVSFSQSHVIMDGNKIRYIIVMFYG